jgi:hypothetical protein
VPPDGLSRAIAAALARDELAARRRGARSAAPAAPPAPEPAPIRPRKYRNEPCELDGLRFDSKAEAARYAELKMLERAGLIRDLRVQPRFPLEVAGKIVATYVADFAYVRPLSPPGGDKVENVVEDVKSQPTRTPVYRLKAKLFLALYGGTYPGGVVEVA